MTVHAAIERSATINVSHMRDDTKRLKIIVFLNKCPSVFFLGLL